MKLLGFLLVATAFGMPLQSEDYLFDKDAFKFGALIDKESLEPPEAALHVSEPTTFVPILPKVNVVTGEYCEEECDLVVAGCEPISYRRFYGHQSFKDPAYGHWRINPECQVVFNFDITKSNKRSFQKLVGIGEDNGSFFFYEGQRDNFYVLDSSKVKCFTHAEATGQNHPLNVFIDHACRKWRDSGEFFYEGIVVDGSGRRREFKSDITIWPTDGGSNFRIKSLPPYQAYVKKERKPNGNIIQYEYQHYADWDKLPKGAQNYSMLKSIKAYNSLGTVLLGSIDIDYLRGGRKEARTVKNISVYGSDKRRADLYHEVREVSPKNDSHPRIVDTVLKYISSAGKPNQSYDYGWQKGKKYVGACGLYRADLPDNRNLSTQYDPNSNKVLAQFANVGPNGQNIPIASYEYFSDHTIVKDGEGNKTLYRFNEDKRIIAVEKYDGDSLCSIEKSNWDANTGNLLEKTIEDATGVLFYFEKHSYDENHNVIEQIVGDGKSSEVVFRRTYSDDGYNLKLTETDREGKLTVFSYIPKTNLLISQLVYENGKIVKRAFNFYDPELTSVCIKNIVDDGNTTNPHDLSGVTYRLITEILPKRTLPCIGLSEEIAKKTIDATGNEILLSRVRYTYHPSGKILQEDHFDATSTFSFSLINEYDDYERLISSTDALGNKTTYQYDNNFNLICKRGPRFDMRKEWVYDLANRPICVKEWQTGEIYLSTSKKYDKASRLISTVDECGFETRYEYDSLGRLRATYYPDGSIERKEYDILGNVVKEIDGNGYIVLTKSNFRNQPIEIIHPDGSKEFFSYHSGSGTLASHTDRNGAKTLYSYDIFDRPLSEEVLSSAGKVLKTSKTTYSTFCKLSETDPEGNCTTYQYDFAGRKIKEELCQKETLFSYDTLGRLVQTQEGDAVYLEAFDFNNQLTKAQTFTLTGCLVKEERYAYDVAGNKIKTIQDSGVFESQFNACGKLILTRDPLGHETQFSYSYSGGFLKQEVDPKGIVTLQYHDCRQNEIKTLKLNKKGEGIQKTESRFDNNKNLIEERHTLFEGTTPFKTITNQWVYGPGNRIERTIESGLKITQFVYDEKGRLSCKIKPDQTPLQSTYDDLGRLSTYSSKDFSYHYTYDRNDRPVCVLESLANQTTTRLYDPYGHIIEEKLGNQLKLAFEYDVSARLAKIIYPNSSIAAYTYLANQLFTVSRKDFTHTYLERNLQGQITKISSGSLPPFTIQYDSLGRWSQFSSPFYSSYFDKHAYDAVSNLCHYTYTDSLGKTTCAYTYDDLNQLTSENDHQYDFDSLSNRLRKDGNTYQINDLCQIEHDGEKGYNYDLNGNLISDGTTTFTYDTLDRLILIQTPSQNISFTYDPYNRRLSKTISKNGKHVQKQLFFYEGENELGSCTEKGEIQELRVLGEGLGAEIGSAVLIELKGKSYVPIHDHRGCIVSLVDLATKSPIDTYRYTAFGEELTKDALSPWRFASKRFEPETGWVFFGRRYYSPSLGRWITADPEGFHDGPNLYAYLHNSPLTDFDLYGLFAWKGIQDPVGVGYGSLEYIKDIGMGCWDLAKFIGEWGYAGHQYLFKNDSSFLEEKSRCFSAGCVALASEAREHPVALPSCLLFPGITDAIRTPSTAPIDVQSRALGRALSDVGLWLVPVLKGAEWASNIGKAGRIGAKFGRAAEVEAAIGSNGIRSVLKEASLVKQGTSATNLTPSKFFGSKTYAEMDSLLTGKFGMARPGAPGGKSFFNPKTGRTFHLHLQEGHMNGFPHVDIKRRGRYKERKYLLKDG